MRRAPVLALIGVLIVNFSACTREAEMRVRVSRFVANTELLSRSFVYTEEAGGETIRVVGRIDDGLRYGQTIRKNGVDVVEQVVDDDAVAIKVSDPSAIPALGENPVGVSAALANVLRSGEWVVDPSGAPPLQRQQLDPDVYVPSNPLEDPIRVLTYVQGAISSSVDIRQWREDDISPAYRAKEDNFPPPDSKNGVRRYDLIRGSLVNVLRPPSQFGAGGGGAAQTQARTSNFRKMAIYVKGETVVKILEDIDVDGNAEVQDAIDKGSRRAVELINNVKTGKTQEKIKIRKMSIEFSDFGKSFGIAKPQGTFTTLAPFFASATSLPAGNIFNFAPPPSQTAQ